jgi:hypothetical protein
MHSMVMQVGKALHVCEASWLLMCCVPCCDAPAHALGLQGPIGPYVGQQHCFCGLLALQCKLMWLSCKHLFSLTLM